MTLEYKLIENIKCYAPDAAITTNDFSPKHFQMLYELEAKNFWFLSRNRILKYLFQKYLNNISNPTILEIGCGTGFVLQELSKFKNFNLYGAELHLDGLKYAQKRLPEVNFIQLDARKIPFKNEFDAIGSFDVLEHIEEDCLIIKEIYNALKKNGLYFISVPQHKWLWSTQDESSLHKRRYSRKELINKLHEADFTIEFISSFVFTLLPIMFLSRLRKKRLKEKKDRTYDYSELNLPMLVNQVSNFFMAIDELLIKFGISLPAGGSLVIVARKKG